MSAFMADEDYDHAKKPRQAEEEPLLLRLPPPQISPEDIQELPSWITGTAVICMVVARQPIIMCLHQAVTCMVAPQALISMSLHIAERVNMIFKQISRLILNLFMNQLPHPDNKNT